MEGFDPEMAARVWQRVQSREPLEPLRPEPGDARQLARELAALYQALARVMPGKEGARLGKLRQEAAACGDCLRGIGLLTGLPAREEGAATPRREPARRMLEKCCHKERRLQAACAALANDPDWGHTYATLAAQSSKRCLTALEILGGMGR